MINLFRIVPLLAAPAMAQVSARRPEASLFVCRTCSPEAMPPPNSFFECCICGSVKKGKAKMEEKPATRLPMFMDVVHDQEEGRTTTTIPNDINDTQELEENATEQIPICRVAAFIDDIEKAHNYFDLRDYLRAEKKFIEYRCSKEDVIDVLFGDPEAKDMLMNLSILDIHLAVNAYLMEVRLKKISIVEHIRRFEENETRNQNGGTFLEEEHGQFGCMFPDFSPEALLKLDQYADSSPVFHLVLRTRETGYVMHWDPKVELQLLMTGELRKKLIGTMNTYLDYYYVRLPPPLKYMGSTVTLMDVSDSTDEQDIREFFVSCGEINEIKLTTQGVVVTFEDSEGAIRALKLSGRELIGSRIRVAPTPFNGLQPPLKDIKAGGSNMYMKGKAENSPEIFTKAVSKYKHLCLYGEHIFSKKQQIFPEVCVLQEPLAALIFSESELSPLRPCTKRGNPLHEAPISD